MTKIIETCETCLYFDDEHAKIPEMGVCAKRAPSHSGRPEVFLSNWCGCYEKQNTQCQECKFSDGEECNIVFYDYHEKNPGSQLSPEQTARFDRTCSELTRIARRRPCIYFQKKDREA